jgi:hypothetical protein
VTIHDVNAAEKGGMQRRGRGWAALGGVRGLGVAWAWVVAVCDTHCIQSAPHSTMEAVSVAREARSAAKRLGHMMGFGILWGTAEPKSSAKCAKGNIYNMS